MNEYVSGLIHIAVDCEKNDPVDIKCGGPIYLGYDFYVKEEDVELIKSLIKSELSKHKQPLISIYAYKASGCAKLWTEELIKECIRKGY